MKTPTQKALLALLDNMPWPVGLEVMTSYERLHDDHDGTKEGRLSVLIGPDGDAHVKTLDMRPFQSLRFRTFQGGGHSLRVRNALLLLAFAIKTDNIEQPAES